MPTVAVLDRLDRFIGVEDVSEEDARNRVVVPADIDLPEDASYRWDPQVQAFVSVVQAAASRAQVPPVSPDYAVFLTLRALTRGEPIPDEVNQYVAWYELYLRSRAEVRARPVKRLLMGGGGELSR